MIALVTDSNAQLTDELRARYRVGVVPLTVVVDGVAYKEGVDLSTDELYDALERGASVSTSAPSPGELAFAYEEAAEGAAGVLSVHVGGNTSATVSAALLAARGAPVPVEVVDTGTASFGVACCVWAAGEALGAGAGVTEAAAEARRVAGSLGNVFVLRTLDRARRGGRLAGEAEPEGVPVYALEDGRLQPVGSVPTDAESVDAMVRYVERSAPGAAALRVGVGDAREPALGGELAARLLELPAVAEVVRYRVGPSVAAHTGLGTVGAVFYDAAARASS